MPPIKLQHVVSCSSEDPNHKADNLLKDETYRKWKSKSAGEKNVSVIIQFEKSSQIHSIDIGNDGSAFVEVLVGKSTSEEFQVMLVSSSFMSPAESKNWNNINRVRIFGSDKLSKSVCNQNWDRVKIVCTQPFNKHTAFGLSFIKFHSPPLPGEETSPQSAKATTTLGAFKIRSDSPQKITPGLFFKTAKEKKEDEPLKGAAAVRAVPTVAVSMGTTSLSSSKSPLPSTQSKRKLSQDDKDEVKPSMSKKRSITPTRERKPEVKAPPLKKIKSEPSKASSEKEFSQLMKGVVFALSGFQNPKRGNLRDKALDMGAKYKSDWSNECTHLICAFANTPKYNQVKKKGGKIASEKWILDCYKRKTQLPWRSYQIGDATSSDEESEEESEDEDDWVPTPKKTTPKKGQTKTTPKQKPIAVKKKEITPKRAATKPDDMYGGSTDEDEKKTPIKKRRRVSSSSSGSDTEDEIERIKQKEKRQSKDKSNDLFGGSTDEDDVDEKNTTDIPDLPEFFKRMRFFFYGAFSAQERRVLNRYIVAYEGAIEEYMTDKVQYVLTHSDWDDHFDQALSDNTTIAFIRPKWIYTCYDKQKMVPYQPYVVVPK